MAMIRTSCIYPEPVRVCRRFGPSQKTRRTGPLENSRRRHQCFTRLEFWRLLGQFICMRSDNGPERRAHPADGTASSKFDVSTAPFREGIPSPTGE